VITYFYFTTTIDPIRPSSAGLTTDQESTVFHHPTGYTGKALRSNNHLTSIYYAAAGQLDKTLMTTE